MSDADRHVELEIQGAIAIARLNRPERLNAFSGRMGRELGAAYRACDARDDVRVVVLTVAGRAFCAGADMSGGERTFASPADAAGFSAAAVDPPAFAIRKPVVAAINGHAIGLGLTLALQCDLRLVARDAKLGVLQVRRGVMPDAYAHWTLARVAGLATAADLLLTGRTIGGDEAVRMGIASRALPADEVLPAALEIARDVAANTAPLSVAITKRLLWESFELTARQVERRETALHHHLMGKSDAIEGALAWVERRPPRWKQSVAADWPDWPTDEEPT